MLGFKNNRYKRNLKKAFISHRISRLIKNKKMMKSKKIPIKIRVNKNKNTKKKSIFKVK
jgi:hypothetical protein